MSYVEDITNSPPAPDWKPTFHGSIDKSLVRSKRGVGDYGEMQIHHVHQWSKARFDEISGRALAGEITLDQAKAEMRKLLTPDSSVRQGYSIKIQRQEDRKLVILASGIHDVNSPLYKANHPMGIHPETGKPEKFGIPKKGDGGREWFDKFRGDFWREYYRKQSFVAANEINRRIANNEESPENVKTMWQKAHGKVVASNDYVKKLREERDR
jgi:hypothetical protein